MFLLFLEISPRDLPRERRRERRRDLLREKRLVKQMPMVIYLEKRSEMLMVKPKQVKA